MAGTLAIVNGRVFGGHGATAVRVEAGRIARVGGRDVAAGADEVVDARGGLIGPGFDDAHIHLLEGARQQDEAQLYPLETQAEVLAAIRAHAATNPGAPWVVGRGWLYAAFAGGLPTRELLDAAVPDRPAWMGCYDGHTGWANGAALRLAGIDRGTPDPPAGLIVRDADGEPTGVLKEDAQALVDRLLPVRSADDDLAAVRRAFTALHRSGITAAQDAWVSLDELAFWRRVRDEGHLALRLRVALPMDHGLALPAWRDRLDDYDTRVRGLRGGEWLGGGILKGFVDGVVEARTAAMLAPYDGDTSTGLPNWDPATLTGFVTEADRRGWQVELHAIGDRGIRLALDAYEAAAAANGPWAGDPHDRVVAPGTHARRHRVEHVETIDPSDVPRFGRLGVVASMQPRHGVPSSNQLVAWAGNIGPERASRAWAWGSIRDAGGRLAFGSDWPVVPFDPFPALHTAVTRQTADGSPEGGWLPGQRLPIDAAIDGYTAGSAFAAFAEHRRGRVVPGLDADLVVLDRDLLAAGPSAIMGTGVVLTVLDGRIVHRSEASA